MQRLGPVTVAERTGALRAPLTTPQPALAAVRRVIEALGGSAAISALVAGKTDMLALRFRPEDPFCHPAFSVRVKHPGLLLQLGEGDGFQASGAHRLDLLRRRHVATSHSLLSHSPGPKPAAARLLCARRIRAWLRSWNPSIRFPTWLTSSTALPLTWVRYAMATGISSIGVPWTPEKTPRKISSGDRDVAANGEGRSEGSPAGLV